jgi:crossover junction endodeoxyribonuclease RusA
MVRVDLPFPPPLSACFTNRVGRSKKTGQQFVSRVTTKRYELWQKQARQMISEQRPAKLSGEVSIYVRLVAPDRRERDAGNCEKAILDSLTKAGIIRDDSNRYVRRLTFEWHDHGPECVVLIQPLEPAQPSLELGR